jgi:hypothetical protein
VEQAAAQAGQTLRLPHLAATFGLDRFDLDVFLVCVAPHLDLRYERLYGFLQDDVTRRRPTVNLMLDLLCEPGPRRVLRLSHLADDAPLLRHHLIEKQAEPGGPAPTALSQSLVVDESVVAWLLGDYRPHPAFAQHLALSAPDTSPTDLVAAGENWPALQQLLGQQRQAPVVALHGPDLAGQEATARLLAAGRQCPLLAVSLDRLEPGQQPLALLRLALRDARLTGALPVITGWEACLTPDASGGPPLPAALDEVCNFPGLVVVTSRAGWQARGQRGQRHLAWLAFETPDYEHRRTLWAHFLQDALAPSPKGKGRDRTAEPGVTQADVDQLAGQFVLTTTQIRDAVAAAQDQALQHGGGLRRAGLFQAARAHSSPGLASLAHKIEARYTWDDIVLPDDQVAMLREIIATVRGRPTVLETWGVGQKLASSAGVTILFAGPPGTGKTMAAEVIASELQLDLYRIDLSTVVNKYVGETEKNLGRIFDEAASSNAILFFDEADAIFGKRSEVKDAHDRYANIEVSYLLQRMETYDGVTVLATNLRANLDEAFSRRLQFAIDFPFPDEAYRLRIWQALFPPDVPRAPDLDLALMARRFKLAGGNIRNIIISAAYLAASDGGQVTMNHLLHGARRELQKMGRLIKEKEVTYG